MWFCITVYNNYSLCLMWNHNFSKANKKFLSTSTHLEPPLLSWVLLWKKYKKTWSPKFFFCYFKSQTSFSFQNNLISWRQNYTKLIDVASRRSKAVRTAFCYSLFPSNANAVQQGSHKLALGTNISKKGN